MPVWIVCYARSVAGRGGDLLAYECVYIMTTRYRFSPKLLDWSAPR